MRPIGVHSPGYVGETDAGAREEFFADYKRMRDRIGAERGWPPMTRQEFDREADHGSLYIGSPETVAKKIAATVRGLGLGRFQLKYSAGPLPHERLLRGIALYGTRVAPLVREMLEVGKERSRPPGAVPRGVRPARHRKEPAIFHLVFAAPCLLVIARWLAPLSLPLAAKATLAVLLLAASQFHLWNRLSSGSVFAPEFPRAVVLALNGAFGAIALLAVLQIALDLGALAAALVQRGSVAIPDGLRLPPPGSRCCSPGSASPRPPGCRRWSSARS